MSTLQSSVRLPLHVPAEDRRSAPRIGVTYRVSLRYGSRESVGYTADISLTGAFVETREEVAPGTPLHLSITVGQVTAEETVEVEGRVARWVSPARAGKTGAIPGLGIEFTRFIWGPGILRHALDQLLADCRTACTSVQRHTGRVAVGLPIYWGDTDKPTLAGFLTNLSTSGAFFIETRSRVPKGTRLHLWFELPVRGEIHVVRAVASVARVTEGKAGDEASGMGVHFEQSSLDSAVLQDFLDGRLSDAPAQAPPAALDRLFVEALAECEEEERHKQLPISPPVHEGLRQDDAPPASDATWVLSRAAGPPAPTTVDWLHAGRLTLKALGMMIVLLLGTFVTLILHLI